MPQTYRATLEDDRIRWHDAEHPDSRRSPVEVQVVVLDQPGEDSLIVSTPGVCGGDACFAGTRIPVWIVVDAWAAGWDDARQLRARPTLRQEHLDAARCYYAAHREEIDSAIADNETA